MQGFFIPQIHNKQKYSQNIIFVTIFILNKCIMQAPAIYNFEDHYQNDGLMSFNITLTDSDTDTPIDLTGAKVRMQLVGQIVKPPVFEFSTEKEGDGHLTIMPNGVIKFDTINSWAVPAAIYTYDLEVTFANGFVKTFLKGAWKINPDITK